MNIFETTFETFEIGTMFINSKPPEILQDHLFTLEHPVWIKSVKKKSDVNKCIKKSLLEARVTKET